MSTASLSAARPAEKTPEDRTAIKELLALNPVADAVDDDDIDGFIRENIIIIAENRKAWIRFVKAEDVGVIDITHWLWDGADRDALLGVMAEATDEALRRWDSAKWVVGGTPMAGGKTPQEMRERSKAVAATWLSWFPSVQMREHEFSNYYYAWSTVAALNEDVKAALRG